MKKLVMVAVVMALGAGVAFASSLGVPWFADNAPAAAGLPPSSGSTTLIYLHNNLGEMATCQIQYYNQEGTALGPDVDNTFTISANASIAFRPVAIDPAAGVTGGQEGTEALLVPDRPRDVDTKKNGSCVIRWFGDPTDVQGMVLSLSGAMSYAHLLPAGV